MALINLSEFILATPKSVRLYALSVTEVSRDLSSLGFKLPAHYSVAWNEEVCMWHGIHCPEKNSIE